METIFGGCLLGLFLALVSTRLLQASLYHVGRFDPITILVVSLGLLAVELFAAYWPAHKATKVDPMVALRYE